MCQFDCKYNNDDPRRLFSKQNTGKFASPLRKIYDIHYINFRNILGGGPPGKKYILRAIAGDLKIDFQRPRSVDEFEDVKH